MTPNYEISNPLAVDKNSSFFFVRQDINIYNITIHYFTFNLKFSIVKTYHYIYIVPDVKWGSLSLCLLVQWSMVVIFNSLLVVHTHIILLYISYINCHNDLRLLLLFNFINLWATLFKIVVLLNSPCSPSVLVRKSII